MFGRVDFRRERERERERKENFLEGVWLGGEERKMMMGPVVLPRLTKKFSPQDGEKIGWGKFGY